MLITNAILNEIKSDMVFCGYVYYGDNSGKTTCEEYYNSHDLKYIQQHMTQNNYTALLEYIRRIAKKCKNIETIVMDNNHLGKEAALADTFGINFTEYSSIYDEENNQTTIHYITYTTLA